jgi:DNA polymerase I
MIYGGGNQKLGLSAGASKGDAARVGSKIRAKVLANLDGFAQLMKAVTARAESGVITGLDGRPIRIRKSHAALNYLLQSAGAIVTKRWVIRANELAKEAGIDYWPVEFVHDEQSWSVAPWDIDKAVFCLTAAIEDVTAELKLRIPMAVDPKVGNTWADVH